MCTNYSCAHLQLYLSDEEFKAAFNGVRRDEFASYPEWKRNQLKKVVKLW